MSPPELPLTVLSINCSVPQNIIIPPPLGAVLHRATMENRSFLPGAINENSPHGLGGGGKEMAAMGPLVAVGCPHQAEVRFMNQSGRLKRVARRLGGQAGAGKATKLIVDQGE